MAAQRANLESLTAYVARFTAGTRYQDIPPDVQELGKKAILDGLAVALSGSVSPPARTVTGYVRELACPGSCTVIGSDAKVAPRFAALANGTAMHADDYDDTLQAETGRYQGVHPTAPVLSAVLAAAEGRDLSGRDLLTAYQVGVEVACRIFDATHVNHILQGYHATATCGMLGAAAGVARLTGLDAERTRMVLGIAASHAGGLQENIGTMVKSLHAGRSAESAIVANDLAARGFTASPIVLESPRGFFMAQGGGHEDARLRGKLGRPWSFADRGIWLKPFPTGSLGHPALTQMLELVIEHDLKPERTARIHVRTSENIRNTLRHHHPATELEAKFSLEFGLVAILFDRKCSLSQFNDEYVRRPQVQQAMKLVDYDTFPESEARANGYTIVTTFLEIELKDGRKLSARTDFGKGSKANPMSMEEVVAKFRECAQYARWPQAKAEQAISVVRCLESLSSVRELAACLATYS